MKDMLTGWWHVWNASSAWFLLPLPLPQLRQKERYIHRQECRCIHINYLILKVGPALNFLKMLSSTYWDSDSIILALFYEKLIRAKLDYGYILYGSANSTELAKVNRIENKNWNYWSGSSIYSTRSQPYARKQELPR